MYIQFAGTQPSTQRTPMQARRFGGWLFLGALILLAALLGQPTPAHAQSAIITVDADAPGPLHNGLSWTTAYTSVQNALDFTNANGGVNYEVWVAEGTYYPDEGGSHANNSRSESFRIQYNNVQVYGGFAATETLRTERDWVAHPTILSGDIDGNDTNTDGNRIAETWADLQGSNAYHVLWLDGVTNQSLTTATVLDGFTISGGNANGAFPAERGGGVYCDGISGAVCSPRLANLRISGNSAGSYGGGMYNDGYKGESSPQLTNVTISGNDANYGGGIFNSGENGESSPALLNSIVWGNVGSGAGAQIYDDNATPAVSYSNVQGSGYVGTGNIDADPLFAAPITGTLAPTMTGDYRLLPGSPAIDSGTNAGAPASDLRELPRPVNGVTDMGAYEAQGFTLAIAGGNNQATTVGAAFGQLLAVQVSSLGGEPLGPGGVIAWTPPVSGAGVTTTAPFTAMTDGSGLAAAVRANGVAGSYAVTATLQGAAGAALFNLANTPVYVTAAVIGTSSGSVTSEPAGIDCGITCTAGFNLSTPLTLTAAASTGSRFSGWAGVCSGTGACTLTVTESKAVTATFTLNQYTVSVSADPTAGGNASGGGTVSHGDLVTVTATANAGYTFVNWTEGGVPVTTTAIYPFTATTDRALLAHFVPTPLAVNDAAGVLEGEAVTIPVLANDRDPAGGGLTVVAVSQPAHGVTSIDPGGVTVRYAALSAIGGLDSFTYTLRDANGQQSTATVAVVVTLLTQTDAPPQVVVLDPILPHTTHFTSTQATVTVDAPAGVYTGALAPQQIFFLSYTPIVTPTAHTLTPPGALRFGGFQFELAAFLDDQPLHGFIFAQPLVLTIRYDPALLNGLEPATLGLFFWDGAGWSTEGITLLSHDPATATLTVSIAHLSEFAFFAAATPTNLDPAPEPETQAALLYLPAVMR